MLVRIATFEDSELSAAVIDDLALCHVSCHRQYHTPAIKLIVKEELFIDFKANSFHNVAVDLQSHNLK